MSKQARCVWAGLVAPKAGDLLGRARNHVGAAQVHTDYVRYIYTHTYEQDGPQSAVSNTKKPPELRGLNYEMAQIKDAFRRSLGWGLGFRVSGFGFRV